MRERTKGFHSRTAVFIAVNSNRKKQIQVKSIRKNKFNNSYLYNTFYRIENSIFLLKILSK